MVGSLGSKAAHSTICLTKQPLTDTINYFSRKSFHAAGSCPAADGTGLCQEQQCATGRNIQGLRHVLAVSMVSFKALMTSLTWLCTTSTRGNSPPQMWAVRSCKGQVVCLRWLCL